MGILLGVLTVLAFPFVMGGLFFNAFMNWRIKRGQKKYGSPLIKEKSGFSDYEIVDDEEALDLSELEKLKKER